MSSHFRQIKEILQTKKCKIIRIILQILQTKLNQKHAARGLTQEANILSLIKSLQHKLQLQLPQQQCQQQQQHLITIH